MGDVGEFLRKIDGHTTVPSEFRVRTGSGALLSVVTLAVIGYLIYTEYLFNFETTILDHVHVNATTPTGLQMEFDVTFPSVPCALLSVDANDPSGQPQSLHLDRYHRVWKHRLTKDGVMIGKRTPFELGQTIQSEDHLHRIAADKGFITEEEMMKKDEDGALSSEEETEEEEKKEEEECGSCYGAGGEGECCNTCDDVKRAYTVKGWVFSKEKIEQCQNQIQSDQEKDEGCNVHGIVALSTGGGNLHLAPGRGLENMGVQKDLISTITDFIVQTYEQFNVSHTVNKLRFGEEFPGHIHQLDGEDRIIQDAYGMYQYYIQIVPTLYRYLNGTTLMTNQYSVTEHMRHVNPGTGRGLPGVFFFYEVSPLHVEIEEYRRGWIRFVTSVCAIVGGVFTVMGMLDNYIFSRMRDSTGLG